MTTPEILRAGQIFAERYRIERFLAKGGFGAVYVAEQLATEMRVALKVLWPHVLQSPDLVEKFKQEARIAGRVNSDHIVRVVDAGFDAPTSMPFLVMELLDGRDLQKVVEHHGPLPPDRVALYLRQAASALDKAHGFRDKEGNPTPIVHRDLKPENLFLTHREDGAPHIKVLDFGIAKVLSAATKVSREVKGTPLYMAVEQASGGAMGPWTDVWALGLIGFYLLTGKSYWRSANLPDATMTQLFAEVLTYPIVPPSLRVVELAWSVVLPAGFDDWFLRCVNRDPSQRFSSAGEAARELSRVLDPGQAAPSSIGPRSVEAAPLSSAVPATSAPLGVVPTPALTGGEAPTSRPLGSTTGLGQSVGVTPRRSSVPLVGAGLLVLGAAAGIAVWSRVSAPSIDRAAPAASPPAASAEAPARSASPPPVAGEPTARPVVSVSAALPEPAPPTPSPSTSASSPPIHPSTPSKHPRPAATAAASPKKPSVYDER